VKVSIITVSYNSELFIRRAIESVNRQDYANIEHLFIDGASTDKTIKIIKDTSKIKNQIISEPDHGIYDAMNKGLIRATGDIVCFLNSDDFYSNSNIISCIVDNFSKHNCKVITSNIHFVDESNTLTRFYKSFGFKKFMFNFGFMPAHPGAFLSKSMVSQLPKFATDLKIASDFEYLLRVYKHVQKSDIFELNETTVLMQDGGISTKNFNSNWIITKEMYKVLSRNGCFASYFLLLLRLPIKYLSVLFK
jgi:glycosyltransferase involved in cell wall biosynthesis